MCFIFILGGMRPEILKRLTQSQIKVIEPEVISAMPSDHVKVGYHLVVSYYMRNTMNMTLFGWVQVHALLRILCK